MPPIYIKMPLLKEKISPKIKFLVVGLMVSSEFQQCRFIVNKLHSYYPDKYEAPEIRPMLNVDWIVHLTKMRRQYGRDLWKLRVPVAVFIDGRFLGDNTTLINYVHSTYTLTVHEDFDQLGEMQLVEHFRRLSDLGRHFVSLAITKDHHTLGVLLVMLYTDLVPQTCRFFLNNCRQGLWNGSRVVRVVKRSWVQFEGAQTKPIVMPCENYAIPHDRRGVVSMCNFSRHRLNSTDFHISLDSTPWMDYKYVGFGLVVQGEEVLVALENTPTSHDVPGNCLVVSDTHEFIVDAPQQPDPHLLRDPAKAGDGPDVDKRLVRGGEVVEDVASVLDVVRFKEGLYCKDSDLVSHFPFVHLPDRLLAYLKSHEVETDEEGGEPVTSPPPLPASDSPSSYTPSTLSSLDCCVNRSKGFLVQSYDEMRAIYAKYSANRV